MKTLSILGSTGSIGQNTLKVARHLGLKAAALAARSNIDLLEQQIREFRPSLVAVYDKDAASRLAPKVPETEVVAGMEGLEAVAAVSEADFVVSAIAGTLGLQPTCAAIEAGKRVGLANKEALVSGGALVMGLAEKHGVSIIPIDSEHSAIFQCLNGEKREEASRLILTSSGGPFRNKSAEELQQATVDDALKHPTWSMGAKVTVDSSTLMNKGLEVIEARWLFGMPPDKIDVVVHPQSIIHSLVEFCDRSMIAQMGEPSMIVPIQYALTYPDRRKGIPAPFDFTKARSLEFFPPDTQKFPCLRLAFDALREGGSLPCYMNGANEELVNRFLRREISWLEIAGKLEDLMERHKLRELREIGDVVEVDRIARREAAAA